MSSSTSFRNRIRLMIGVAVAVAVVLGPLVWTAVDSLKTETQVTSTTPVWFFIPTLENYGYLLISGSAFLPGTSFALLLLNSLVVAGASSIAAVLLSLPLAFLISRTRFGRFSAPLFYLAFASRMVPQFSIALPLFYLYNGSGLLDTVPGLVILYSVLNLSITLPIFSSAFGRIPQEVDDSVRIEGYSRSDFFLRMAIKLIAPSILAAFALSFLLSWNELPYARILTRSGALTSPVGVLMMIPPPKDFDIQVFQFMGSAAIFQILPALVLVVLLRRFILQAWEGFAVD